MYIVQCTYYLWNILPPVSVHCTVYNTCVISVQTVLQHISVTTSCKRWMSKDFWSRLTWEKEAQQSSLGGETFLSEEDLLLTWIIFDTLMILWLWNGGDGDLNPFNIPTPESCCPVQTFNENSHTGSDLISACTNLQDLMLLLQVVFPLPQPGQRLPRLLQAVLPAYQLQDCKGGQLVVKGCMNVMETSDFMETGKSETCNGNNFSGRWRRGRHVW